MFDPETEELVSASPALNGLDPSLLAIELTKAQVEIAHLRLMLASETMSFTDLENSIDRLSRLSATLEGYVVLEISSATYRNSAYVAACARQLVASMQRIRWPERQHSALDSGDLDAMLLFLVAGRPVDAQAIAKQIAELPPEKSAAERLLLLACQLYASGQIEALAELGFLSDDSEYSIDIEKDLLCIHLVEGLRELAKALKGHLSFNECSAVQYFEEVKKLGQSKDFIKISGNLSFTSVSVYATPVHIANLLIHVSKRAQETSLVDISAPAGVDSDAWKNWLISQAKTRPFLWPNHVAALGTGYLTPGKSIVMATPTGSGKSTLAVLKIAACLASGQRAIFLAPTHALVHQVETELESRLKGLSIEHTIEDLDLVEDVKELPTVAILTPERCLSLLAFSEDIFSNVGLLVFDECHLLGTSGRDGAISKVNRRNVDAMLCLLQFAELAPHADLLLLSAMIENASEVAEWISSSLERDAIAFDGRWKPTRQVRGCVVYDKAELAKVRRAVKNDPKFEPVIQPYGLFKLSRAWEIGDPDNLMLRQLGSDLVSLGKNKSNRITSNRNKIAARLAVQFARQNLKVLVFCENARTCASVAKEVDKKFDLSILQPLSTEESEARDRLIENFGGISWIFDVRAHACGIHHGDLFPSERELVENRFREKNSGMNVLAATSTLAQGLNLPCDVVILAGTDRVEEDDEGGAKREALAQHEILNALGRAGRAGFSSVGLAIVVPADPIDIVRSTLDTFHEAELELIFASDDRCTSLTDPLGILIDQLEIGSVNATQEYLLRRLAPSLDETDRVERLLSRSFAYSRLRKKNESDAENWLHNRHSVIQLAMTGRDDMLNIPLWQRELTMKSGASETLIQKMVHQAAVLPVSGSARFWLDFVVDLLAVNDVSFDAFLRPETMQRVFSRAYDNSGVEARTFSKEVTLICARSWISGVTVSELEVKIVELIRSYEGDVKRKTGVDGKATHARRFILRALPDISFLLSIFAQVVKKCEGNNVDVKMPFILQMVPQLIREGVENIYQFVLIRKLGFSRREALELFPSLAIEVDPFDNFYRAERKITNALLAR